MSIFSDSFHLKTDHDKDCIDLLNSCGAKGYVFPAVNGWTSFVCKEAGDLLRFNEGFLLQLRSREEIGWRFELFKRSQSASCYECRWGGPIFDEYGKIKINEDGNLVEVESILINDADLNIEELLPLLENEFVNLKKIKQLLYPHSFTEAIETSPSFQFAAMLGIENVECVSYDFIYRNKEDFPQVMAV